MKRADDLSWPTYVIEQHYRRLNPSPTYQRGAVWTREQKQLLIDSILRNMDIPKLYFRQMPDDSTFDYEVIDGQQRVRTIWEYRTNQFSLSARYTPELGALYYRDLPERIRRHMDRYRLTITVISEASEREVRDMFYRLQNGRPLTPAEQRNAIGGGMRDFIADLTEMHPVFAAFQEANNRMAHQQIAAQCALLELNGGLTHVGGQHLERMYVQYADFDPDSPLAQHMIRVMDFLARAFADPTPEFSGRAQFVSLYWMVSQMLTPYAMEGCEPTLRRFFVEFERRRMEQQKRGGHDLEMERYTQALRYASDKQQGLMFRHYLLTQEWLLFVPDLALRDPHQPFTEEQRVAIYRRDSGVCRLCGQPVPFEQFTPAYIHQPQQGGRTAISNAQTAHTTCINAARR